MAGRMYGGCSRNAAREYTRRPRLRFAPPLVRALRAWAVCPLPPLPVPAEYRSQRGRGEGACSRALPPSPVRVASHPPSTAGGAQRERWKFSKW